MYEQSEPPANLSEKTGHEIYEKGWLSVDQQLELLRRRGMEVGDEEAGRHYLLRIGYYRLSGYWYAFRKTRRLADGQGRKEDNFAEGTHLDDAVNLYFFDKELRLLAMNAVEGIEVAMRVDLAYRLGEEDPLFYLNDASINRTRKPFHTNMNNKTAMELFERWKLKHENSWQKSNEEFVLHFRDKYGFDTKPPVWIACEVWNFGAAYKLFDLILDRYQKTIANRYGVPQTKVFASWIRAMNGLRNACSHHDRLWDRSLEERYQPELPRSDHAIGDLAWCRSWPGASEVEAAKTKPFLLLAIARHLVKSIGQMDPDLRTWPKRMKRHLKAFPRIRSTQQVSLNDMGVVKGWEKWW